MQTSQTLLKQQKRQNAEVELNFKVQLEGLVKQYQNKLHQAESSLKEAKAVVQEFITFTMVHEPHILNFDIATCICYRIWQGSYFITFVERRSLNPNVTQ